MEEPLDFESLKLRHASLIHKLFWSWAISFFAKELPEDSPDELSAYLEIGEEMALQFKGMAGIPEDRGGVVCIPDAQKATQAARDVLMFNTAEMTQVPVDKVDQSYCKYCIKFRCNI